MIKRRMISIDGEQIDKLKDIPRKDLKGYDETKLIRIAIQEWLKEQYSEKMNGPEQI